MKYNKKADKALADLYRSVGARTWKQKFHTLELALGVPSGSTYFSHDFGWEAKVGALEYEYLAQSGLIELTLV